MLLCLNWIKKDYQIQQIWYNLRQTPKDCCTVIIISQGVAEAIFFPTGILTPSKFQKISVISLF